MAKNRMSIYPMLQLVRCLSEAFNGSMIYFSKHPYFEKRNGFKVFLKITTKGMAVGRISFIRSNGRYLLYSLPKTAA